MSADPDRQALDALDAKVKAAQAKHAPTPVAANRSGMGKGLQAAAEFTSAILVGAVLGYGFDYFASTSPWGMIVGLFLGLSTGIYNIVRTAKEGMDGSGEDMPLTDRELDDEI